MKRNRSSQLLAAILVNSVYEMKNYPTVLLNSALSPLSFLLLIVFVSQGRLVGVGIEGGLIMTMFSAGTSLQADLSHLKNDYKLQDMIVSSPTSWQMYVAGMAISEIVYSSPALVALGVLAAYFVNINLIGILILIAVLVSMFFASIAIGYTLASFSNDIVQSFSFSRLISTLFATIPPVYYPITYIPFPWRYLAYLSPTTYAAELAQNAADYLKLTSFSIAIDWAILIGVTVVLLILASSQARWREV